MFSQDILELQDDGFDGSNEELLISQEVFYGNAAGFVSKKSGSTGVASSTSVPHKVIETLPCPNIENSALTIQASSEDLCQKDAVHAEQYRDSQSRSSLEVSVKDERSIHDVQAKRVKLSLNELCSFKPILDDAVASSVPLKQVVYGMHYSTPHPSRQILMSHVVESSSDGLTSSCYLLQKDLESAREGNLAICVAPNCILSGSDGSEKQIGACKSMASPISQESSATKRLASRSPRLPKKRSKIAASHVKDENVKLTGSGMKHLSTLLRSEVYRLLDITGWSHEKQIRNDGRNRFLYRSPKGKCARALARVWYLVGNALFAHNNSKMMMDDKQWTDYNKFCSDLNDTLNYIGNKKDEWKTRCALACMWRLLDPFVNVVLLNRKIISLRNGNLVKASQSNVFHQDGEAEVENKLNSENCDVNVDMKVDKNGDEIICDSSLTFDTRETHKMRSIYVSEGDNMCLVKTIDNDENHCLGTPTDINMHITPGHSADVSDKSGKFPAVELCELCQFEAGDILLRDDCRYRSILVDQLWSKELTKKEKKKSKLKKSNGLCFGEPNSDINGNVCKKRGRPKKLDIIKKSSGSHLNDDDLLVSAVIKKRGFGSGKNKLGPKPRKFKSKTAKKRKSKKGGCRLRLRGIGKAAQHFTDRWTQTSERTVLSWLISTGNVSVNETIQYRDPKNDSVVKDGVVSREGILCKCCSVVLSISDFKIHAGFNQNRPCLNLFLGSGRPYTLSQLEAWSAEYKARKSSTLSVGVDEFDKNDDSCGICGDVGELLCCDNCPSTFHQSCLSAEELPEGSWYCSKCTCQVCEQLADDNEGSSSHVTLRCSQCEKKFHQACLTEKDMDRDGGAPWFCGVSCAEVHDGLQSRIGLSNQIGDGFSWTLLRCIHDDQKVSSPQRLALKAECNSKLAVAATIMEECFLAMIDPRTGIDMIPQVVYNWGSEFARLDYHGFYTAVLEKNDTLISIASIRVHGVAVAEMPLIATCSKFRRQGMCRRLLTSVEKMLISLKVEKLVIAAVPDLVETWTVGFGFVAMEEDEKLTLNNINMMVFPGTIILKKTLFVDTSLQRGGTHECGEDAEENFEVLKGCNSFEPENMETIVEDLGQENGVSVHECGEDAEEDFGNLKGCNSFEPENMEIIVSDLGQGNRVSVHSNMLVDLEKETIQDSDGVSLPVAVLSSESKLNEDFSQHTMENQDDYLQVSEEQNFPGTAPKTEIVQVTSISKAETVIEDSSTKLSEVPECMDIIHVSNHLLGNGYDEVAVKPCETRSKWPSENASQIKKASKERNCVDQQCVKTENIVDADNMTEERMTNESVSWETVMAPEEASQGTEKGGESKMTENVTSDVGELKESGEHGQSITLWKVTDKTCETRLESPSENAAQIKEASEQRNCAGDHRCGQADNIVNGSTMTEERMTNESVRLETVVGLEEASQGTEKEDESKTMGNLISNIGESKEPGENDQSINLWEVADQMCETDSKLPLKNATQIKEAFEESNCVDHQCGKIENMVNADNITEEGMTNESVCLEMVVVPKEASEGTEKGGESKMIGNVSELNEPGEIDQSINSWDVSDKTCKTHSKSPSESATQIEIATQIKASSEERNCVEDCRYGKAEHIVNGSTMTEDGITHESIRLETEVGLEKASEGTEQGGESKTTGGVTSNAGKLKEPGENGQNINLWEYWDECVGDLELLDQELRLDDRCRYGEQIVAKERVSNGEPECINVAKNQLSVVKESQEGNVVP